MKNLTVKLTLIFTLICLGVVDAWAVKTELATYNFTNGTTMPTNVTKNSKTFAGWYADSACTQKLEDATITSRMTIDAKWE